MRLRRVDVLLLAVALPVWGALTAFTVFQVAAGRPTIWTPQILLAQGTDPSNHPVVRHLRPGWEAGRVLARGDVLLQVGPYDLAGATRLALIARAFEQAARELPVPLTVRRGNSVSTVALDLRRAHPVGVAPIWTLLTAIACVLTGVLVLLRAPDARAARPLFVALTSAQLYFTAFFPGPPLQTYALILTGPVGAAVSVPCFLVAMLLLVPETAPTGGWRLWWPWLFAPLGVAGYSSTLFDVPWRGELTWQFVEPVGWAAFALGMLVVLTRNLRHADPVGRRRIKWVVYGCFVLYAPRVLQSVVALLGGDYSIGVMLFALSGMVLPACLFIAIVRHNLFDIDRLISVTASYTVLGILAVGVILAGFPRVAALASARLGFDPGVGQLVFAAVIAAVIVPAQRALRPQIDRLFFAERYALECGVADLLRDLSDCPSPEVLFSLTGERLDMLVRPDSCVVYARTGETFAPAFVRGRVVPTAFEAHGPRVAALARRTALLVAEGRRRGGVPSLGAFDRAALETLGAAVVVPARRRDALVAFVCLGTKRSGDIYTTTDVTLLEAVARKVSDELIHFDLDEIVRRGRAMEESLRRYVPAAVITQLATGRDVEAAEREVSVLFVDIRGYTSFAEARQASEVFTTVNRYTEAVSAIAREHGGSVAEFSGDGMMVVFGAPQALAAKERAAVEAGRAIVDAVTTLRPDGPGSPPLAVGVGIATGLAYVGDVRSAERRIWTAIGSTVNLAARLQQLTRSLDGAMVIDGVTCRAASLVAADFVCRAATPIRGRSAPEDVWVLPLAANASAGSVSGA